MDKLAAPDVYEMEFPKAQFWKTTWERTTRPEQFTLTRQTKTPAGSELPRKEWVTLNRLRTGVGQFNSNMHRWGLRPSAACVCGEAEQTAHHILNGCRILRPPDGRVDLHPVPWPTGSNAWKESLDLLLGHTKEEEEEVYNLIDNRLLTSMISRWKINC